MITTTKQLEDALTANLKTYIRNTHYESGELFKSAKVKVTGELDIRIVGAEYIQYLDEGQFVQNFMDLPTTTAILEDYLTYIVGIQITK